MKKDGRKRRDSEGGSEKSVKREKIEHTEREEREGGETKGGKRKYREANKEWKEERKGD